MSKIQSILSVLIKQKGNRVVLKAGQQAQFFDSKTPIKIFLPVLDEDTLWSMLQEIDPQKRSKNKQIQESFSFQYQSNVGLFRVTVSPTPTLTIILLQTSQTVKHSSSEVTADSSAAEGLTSQVKKQPPDQTKQSSSNVIIPAQNDFILQPKHQRTPQAIYHQGMIHLLEYAIAAKASDVHLSSDETPMLRIDGILRPLQHHLEFPLQHALESLVTVEEKDMIHRGYTIDRGVHLNHTHRARINVFLHKGGWAAAIRLLNTQAPTFSTLRLPKELESIAMVPHGLVLICGPTGSGKSTTLASLIQYILSKKGGLLVTLEDPIEYIFQASNSHTIIRQRELGVHVKSFAAGLKSALREDPNIILIGELRDADSIRLAITAAETGHLVLSSLHSRSAISAIDRMIDSVEPEAKQQVRYQLSEALQAVVSQRLLPKKHGDGRVVAVECLRNTMGISNMIREAKGSQMVTAIQSGGQEGMLLLEKSLSQLVMQEMISREVAQANTNYPTILQRYLE